MVIPGSGTAQRPAPARPGRRHPWCRWRLMRLLWLLCLVPVVCGLSGALPDAPAAAADHPVWRLPLDGRPRLVAPFMAPAGPYAAGHRGVDLAAAAAARVLAAGDGVVAFAGRVAGRGVVSVDHTGGLRTTYQPVAAVVQAGDPVTAGAVLGLLAGAGGHCPPVACLHWGARRGETYLDPMALLGTVRVRLLPVWSSAPVNRPSPVPTVPTGRAGSPSATASADRGPAAPTTPVDRPPTGPVAPRTAALASLAALTGGLAAAAASLRRRAPP
jgi:murein DD-endopeptidase MepM/ murein hydrolase activator NlpD